MRHTHEDEQIARDAGATAQRYALDARRINRQTRHVKIRRDDTWRVVRPFARFRALCAFGVTSDESDEVQVSHTQTTHAVVNFYRCDVSCVFASVTRNKPNIYAVHCDVERKKERKNVTVTNRTNPSGFIDFVTL